MFGEIVQAKKLGIIKELIVGKPVFKNEDNVYSQKVPEQGLVYRIGVATSSTTVMLAGEECLDINKPPRSITYLNSLMKSEKRKKTQKKWSRKSKFKKQID